VAQTEGADLPEYEHHVSGEVGAYRDRLIAFLAQQNIALEFDQSIAPALGVSYGGKIALLPGSRRRRSSSVWPMKPRTSSYINPTAAP
jgi:hypothetical protein